MFFMYMPRFTEENVKIKAFLSMIKTYDLESKTSIITQMLSFHNFSSLRSILHYYQTKLLSPTKIKEHIFIHYLIYIAKFSYIHGSIFSTIKIH